MIPALGLSAVAGICTAVLLDADMAIAVPLVLLCSILGVMCGYIIGEG